MGKNDPRIDAYIAHSAEFAQPILAHIRKLVHTACPEVEEAWKWSFPHFMHKGILCSMASFKNHCAFGFWKGALMFGKDSPGKNREDDAMGQFGRITSISDLPADDVLLAYIRKAVRLNDAGIPRPVPAKRKPTKALAVPDDFVAALQKNKRAWVTFENFSYSHRKEYVEWITEAKREETRKRRMQMAIEWMTKGKPRNWKYHRC